MAEESCGESMKKRAMAPATVCGEDASALGSDQAIRRVDMPGSHDTLRTACAKSGLEGRSAPPRTVRPRALRFATHRATVFRGGGSARPFVVTPDDGSAVTTSQAICWRNGRSAG